MRYTFPNATSSKSPVHARFLRQGFPQPSRRESRLRNASPEQRGDGESLDRSLAASSDEETDHDLTTDIPLHASSNAPSTTESINESTDENAEPNESPRRLLQLGSGFEVYNIQVSRYLEDEYGTDEVRMKIQHEPISANASGRLGALFRWIHVKQDPMNFGVFRNAVNSLPESLPDLSKEDLENAMRLLQKSQDQAQRLFKTKDGIGGRIFDPHFLSREMSKDPNIEDRCFFYSLPYFCLRKYTELSTSSNSSLQPIRTLLQTRDPSTPKGRDLSQVVCNFSETPKDQCFHLATLWCLVIKDKYLLTCSLHSGIELAGELLEVSTRPPSQPSEAASWRLPLLQVVFENALYLIPLNECNSWFKFTQRFSVFGNNFDDVYSVHSNGRQIESGQWHALVKRAMKRPMRTRIFVLYRKQGLTRPLNKPLLGNDDGSDIDPSRPSTSSGPVPSSASLAGLEKHVSTSEEEGSGRRRSGQSDTLLKAPLSPERTAQDPLKRPPSASPMSFESYLQDFHALRWISLQFSDLRETDDSADTTRRIPRITRPDDMLPRKSYDERVNNYLEELHTYMQSKVGTGARARYQRCSKKSLKQVEKELRGISRGGLDDEEVVRLKEEIVTAAKSIFIIFLPLDQKGSIVSKYWGAVHDSIIAKMTQNISTMKETIQLLLRIARFSINMQAQLSKGKGPDPAETKLPAAEFVNAWLFLLICLLHLTDGMAVIARKKATNCERYLRRAMEITTTTFQGKPLPQLRAPVPSELSVLFAYRVLQDMTGDLPAVSDTYWNYFTQLTSLVRKDPMNKGHRAKFAALFEELDIIENQLKEQHGIVKKLQDGPLSQRHHERHKAFTGRYHVRLLEKCNDHLSGTKESLSELQRQAKTLESSTIEYVQSNKERQERAIYIFTIVTIVFLPISTVSSIFGMNASDIRGMNQGQWLFWAVAIPVTAVVVVGSLFGAGVISYHR